MAVLKADKQREAITPASAKKLLIKIMRHNLLLAVFDGSTSSWIEKAKSHNEYIIPMLWGPPGVGKTAIVGQAAHEISEEFEIPFPVMVEKLAIKEPTEVGGYPFPDKDSRTFSHIIAERWKQFATQGPGAAFLDEYAQGNVSQQNGGRNITNERKIGDHDLCPGTTVIAASNMMENRAGTTPMPSQAKDVFTHFYVKADPREWCTFGMQHGFNPLVTSFIWDIGAEYLCPDLDTSAGANNAQPSPRSWERVSRIISAMDWDPSDKQDMALRRVMVNGMVGELAAGNFFTHVELVNELPDKNEVLEGRKLSKKLNESKSGLMCLFCMILAANANAKNLANLATWCRGLSRAEYGSMVMNMARNIKKELAAHPSMIKWMVEKESNLIIG